MNTAFSIIALVLLPFAQLSAQEGFSADGAIEEKSAPSFEAYRVAKVFTGTPRPVKLTTSEARMFRTRLRESAKQGVNFAGHYVVAIWGCGSGCASFAFIDAKTGKVYFPPLSLVGVPIGQDLDPLLFRKDSRLFRIVGSRNDQGLGTYFYEWRNNRFRLVREYENKQVR